MRFIRSPVPLGLHFPPLPLHMLCREKRMIGEINSLALNFLVYVETEDEIYCADGVDWDSAPDPQVAAADSF